jgi:tRNA A-37 threonylcarbamoyl transferase component Bud32
MYRFTTGRSGATVELVTYKNNTCVKKTNIVNADKVVEAMKKCCIPTPHVYEFSDTHIIMEYLSGTNVYEFLMTTDKDGVDYLINEIKRYINHCLDNSTDYDFKNEIEDKIKTTGVDVKFDNTIYPQSYIHGDLTFDNMVIHNDRLYFIDFNYTPLNSVYFDINKLRQDLDAYWFVRFNDSIDIRLRVNYIREQLFCEMFNDDIYKFMLSRILPYVSGSDGKFIKRAIDNIR